MNGNSFCEWVKRAQVGHLVALALVVGATLEASALEARMLQAQIQSVSAQVADSCVSIHSLPRDSWGSGVIVSAEGHLFTAAHVVSEVGEITEAHLSDGSTVLAKVLMMDLEIDAAVLQFVRFRPEASQVAALTGEDAERGDACVAIGHALGYDAGRGAPVRLGFLSNRTKAGNLLTTCRMAAGDSGGPLFSLSGELLAIHRTVDAGGEFSAHIPVSDFTKRFASVVSSESKLLAVR